MKFEPVSLGSGFGIQLKLDANDKIQNKKQLEPYLTFNIRTYKVLSTDGDKPEKFRTVTGCSNWYFEHIPDDKKQKLVEFFALACQMIRSEMPKVIGYRSKMIEFITGLGEMYTAIVDECGLREEFAKYATDRVQLQDISGYGSRPQDSKELTFGIAEMCELMNLAFLIKFIAPLFGELILNIPDTFDDEGNKKTTEPKDIKVVCFLQPLITKHFSALDSKLQYFIEHIVTTQLKNNNTAAAIFAGLIPARRVEWIRAAILVRNFVCCELERKDSNIVRFVDTMVHSHLISQSNFANRNQVRPRKPVASFGSGEDSDNTAQMETDSVVSMRPMDTSLIIAAEVDRLVGDFLLRFEFTSDELETCQQFLMNHPVIPTPLNRFVACAIFGDQLGGGRGIEMLEREPYTKLICLLQMIAFKHNLIEFGHMVTAGRTDAVRVTKSADDIKFELNYGTSYAYRNCKEKFIGSSKASDGKEWDRQMKDITDDIIQTCYVYNTPDFIMDKLGDNAPVNGEEIPIEVEIITEACTLIDMFTR